MLQLAQRAKIFRIPTGDVDNVRIRMIRTIGKDSTIDERSLEMISRILCLSSTDNRLIFSAAALGEKEAFKAHCVAATATTTKAKNPAPIPEPLFLDRLWTLTQNTLPQVMALTRATLTRTESPVLLYKALQFHNEHRLKSWMKKMTKSPHCITGWTSSLTDAIRNSTPNLGIKGRLSFAQRRLRRNGFETEAVTNIGAVAVFNARAINVGRLTRGNTEDTWWLHEPNADTDIHVTWADDPGRKSKILSGLLPNLAKTQLLSLPSPGHWVVAITAGKTPGRPDWPMKAKERKEGSAPVPHWIDVDESAIDFTLVAEPLPHIEEPQWLPTPPPQGEPNTGAAEPIPMRIEGHTYWHQAAGGLGPQKWVFNKADEKGHKVCVMLQRSSRRHYASFDNIETFWAYYRSFQGPRSFYWINRSYELEGEMSILYLDIEWYSETEDPSAEERLAIIKNALQTCLPRPCQITEERLSRPHYKYGWKNSWHFYTDVFLEHNAKGCMKSFVVNKLWQLIKEEPLMWCSSTVKPILDLKVYTKNRCFRIPGSTKWPKHFETNPPLPPHELFMLSRMADRPGPPTYTTQELNIWKSPPIPSTTPLPTTSMRIAAEQIQGRPNPGCTSRSEIVSASRKNIKRKRCPQTAVAAEAPQDRPKPKRACNGTLAKTDLEGKSDTPRPSPKHATIPRSTKHRAPLKRAGTYNPWSYLALTRRFNCPVTGCGNFGGRGFMRSTIVKHLNNHRDAIRSNPAERAKVRAIAETVGDLHCCKLCG